MNGTNSFGELSLDAGSSSSDYPRGYQVNVSNDGLNWGSPVATGVGAVVTTITFPAQTARYIRITQTGSNSTWWSIYEFYVYSAATTPTNLTATAGNSAVVLGWANALGATSYNVKRSSVSGGPYTNAWLGC